MLFENRRQAEETAREVNRRLSIAGVPALEPAAGSLNLKQLADLWLGKQRLRVEAGNKKASSLGADLYRLKPLIAYFGNEAVSAIDETRVLQYQAHRRRLRRRPATINSEVGTLKHILKEGKKRGAIPSVPEVERIRQAPRNVEIPTEAEMVRLIEAAPLRLRVLLAFLAETGCRRGEALNLTWDAIDEPNGFARIEPRDGWTPKTASSHRRVPLTEGLLAALRILPRTGAYVFPGRRPDKPMTDFKRALVSAVKASGLVRNGKPMRITPHVLRKANASWLAARRVHPRVVQSLLGHSAGSRMTDQHYIQTTDETLREAAINLPLWSANEPKNLATSGNT
jgi:integrase